MAKMTYHNAPSRVEECYYCGEKVMCEIIVADSPDPETGYVDGCAICEQCKKAEGGR